MTDYGGIFVFHREFIGVWYVVGELVMRRKLLGDEKSFFDDLIERVAKIFGNDKIKDW